MKKKQLTDDEKLLIALDMVKEKYKQAQDLPWVHNPLGYALYNTWKVFSGFNGQV